MSTTPLKPPAPYYGGKTRLAPWIATLLEPHHRYVEPFMGTAAVLLAKQPSKLEVINDLDGDVVTFFRVLRDRPEELERACRLTPYARAEFLDVREPVDGLDDVERARRWWCRVVQGFNSSPGLWATGWSLSVRRGSTSEPSTAANLVERFEAIAERLRRVGIENVDALELIARMDDDDTAFYCDPPYLNETRKGRERRSAVHDYAHDMLSADQHEQLSDVLRACRGHVLLSGYASDLYAELYADWWCVEQRIVNNASRSTGKSTRATEVIWSNRPLDAGGLW